MSWTCQQCTFDNKLNTTKCYMCENGRNGALENIDINKKLSEKNQKIHKIKGDGNCLYECFATFGKCTDQLHLRKMVASELEAFEPKYKTFIANSTFEEHLKGVREHSFADHLEIQIISNIFGLNIIIYHNNTNKETPITPQTEPQSLHHNNKIYLLYSSNHYDLVVPIEKELNKNCATKELEDTSGDELMATILQMESILSN